MKNSGLYRVLLSLLVATSASACASINEWLGGESDRPMIYVLTHQHGTQAVFTDMDGLPYRKGSTIPFVEQTDCRFGIEALRDKYRCGEVGGAVFDGVVVERIDSRQCKVTETTVARMDVIRVNNQTSTIPRVAERTWTVMCR